MPFVVVSPSKDEQVFAKEGRELLEASKRLGFNFDPQGFLSAWVGGTRVAAEKDAEGQIVGMAVFAVGKRWVQNDFTATMLDFNGSEQLLDFVKQLCKVFGATTLFMETRQLTETTFEITRVPI